MQGGLPAELQLLMIALEQAWLHRAAQLSRPWRTDTFGVPADALFNLQKHIADLVEAMPEPPFLLVTEVIGTDPVQLCGDGCGDHSLQDELLNMRGLPLAWAGDFKQCLAAWDEALFCCAKLWRLGFLEEQEATRLLSRARESVDRWMAERERAIARLHELLQQKARSSTPRPQISHIGCLSAPPFLAAPLLEAAVDDQRHLTLPPPAPRGPRVLSERLALVPPFMRLPDARMPMLRGAAGRIAHPDPVQNNEG